MNELKIFEHPDFGKIRTVTIDDEPYLVGKDVAEVLGYSNTKRGRSGTEMLQDVWIVELGELDSIKKGDQTAVKNFITSTTDRDRAAYAHTAKTYPRMDVALGEVLTAVVTPIVVTVGAVRADIAAAVIHAD